MANQKWQFLFLCHSFSIASNECNACLYEIRTNFAKKLFPQISVNFPLDVQHNWNSGNIVSDIS